MRLNQQWRNADTKIGPANKLKAEAAEKVIDYGHLGINMSNQIRIRGGVLHTWESKPKKVYKHESNDVQVMQNKMANPLPIFPETFLLVRKSNKSFLYRTNRRSSDATLGKNNIG